MTREDIRGAIVSSLTAVAPEIDPSTLSPDLAFRQEFDLDSMDFLNFVIGLNKQTGLEIPEADYSQIQTLSGAADYLRTHWPRAFG
jgi:acyl carrier protein